MPMVVFSTENERVKKLAQTKEATDLVIIDTYPACWTEAEAAVEAADLVLIMMILDVELLEQMPRCCVFAAVSCQTHYLQNIPFGNALLLETTCTCLRGGRDSAMPSSKTWQVRP